MVEISNIEKLKEALKDIPSHHYSLEGYSENAVCLEKTDSSFEVYFAEKNQKWDIKEFDSEKDACTDMYSRLAKYVK